MCGQHVKLLDSFARQMGDEFVIDNKTTAPPACASDPNSLIALPTHTRQTSATMECGSFYSHVSPQSAASCVQHVCSKPCSILPLPAAAGARRTWWSTCSGASQRAAHSRCSRWLYCNSLSHVSTGAAVAAVGLDGAQVLRAMLRGCWLLSFDWVEESQRVDAWQPESEFEVQVQRGTRACKSSSAVCWCTCAGAAHTGDRCRGQAASGCRCCSC